MLFDSFPLDTQVCKFQVNNFFFKPNSKPSLKIRTTSAIFWNYLGIFRDYDQNLYFWKYVKLFVFQDRMLKLSASVWKIILWNLTKFPLNQTTDWKNGNKNCLNELNELKFCEAVLSKYAKIVPKDGACCPNFQWRFWVDIWMKIEWFSLRSVTLCQECWSPFWDFL